MREDAVPHEGQEAVGNVVRRVSVISSATSTSSTSISGRSGKMIIGFLSILEKVKQEKMFNLLVYHKCDRQSCVTTITSPLLTHNFGSGPLLVHRVYRVKRVF